MIDPLGGAHGSGQQSIGWEKSQQQTLGSLVVAAS